MEPRLSADILREPEIKAALIDALYAEGMVYGDTVLVNEMPVAHMSRRADIVIANGYLIGFEIKSDGDKICRLPGQLEVYQQSFEGVVIVTGAKHLEKCLATTKTDIGVVAIDYVPGNRPGARMLRKPYLRKMSAKTAVQQMRSIDLYRLTRSLNINPSGARDRYTLETLVKNVPADDLRQAALSAIKQRYRRQFEEFQAVRERNGSTTEAIRLLNRPARNKRHSSPSAISPVSLADVSCDLTSLKLSVRPRRTP